MIKPRTSNHYIRRGELVMEATIDLGCDPTVAECVTASALVRGEFIEYQTAHADRVIGCDAEPIVRSVFGHTHVTLRFRIKE